MNGKVIFYSIVGVIGFLAVSFLIGVYGLGMDAFFRPKYENIKRNTFENTQSYVHGAVKNLARLMQQYNETDDLDDKEIIQDSIRQQFAEFDSEKIQSYKLKNFLEKMRGY